MLEFIINHKSSSSKARTGTIKTLGGDISTPAFIVVGTNATVRAVPLDYLPSIGAQALLANTYHLYLQPGLQVVGAHDGFAKMMGWSGPTFTDSGGFQVFSLGNAYGQHVSKVASTHVNVTDINQPITNNIAKLAQVDDDGVTFKSHRDGSYHRFTPESSMEIQWILGADIIFAFDECTSPTDSYEYQKESLVRTHNWAHRSLAKHKQLDTENKQSLFGVVQGGSFEDLRRHSARTLAEMDFDGYGIGGSFTKADLQTAVLWATSELPENKPRHLLGIGEPIDFFLGVEAGIDTFDCVSPTRLARHGGFYTDSGVKHIKNSQYRTDMSPLCMGCDCIVCARYTRAYLAHLAHAGEMLMSTLLSIHNLRYIVRLVDRIGQSIKDDTYDEFKKDFLCKYYGSY